MKPRSSHGHRIATAASVLGLAAAGMGLAAPSLQFNRDIRPILSDHCFSCHGPDGNARKAGLRLDTKEGLHGGTRDEGPVVVPGNPDQSALWKRMVATDPDEVMPPPSSHKELKQEQRDTLRRWIEEGAPWQPHWAFIKPERPPIPAVSRPEWIRNPIDAFVLSKLDSLGLQPAPEADRRTLARRLALDLTGLPPRPEDVEAFVRDSSALSADRFIRALMQRPAWGEHRARYWLDAARYADTHGLHFDNYREMWPYRDWVIRAFNRNQRFDQFTVEQLAGDLLPSPSDDQLVATGFHRCNMTTNEGGTIEEENLVGYARDRVETTSWVWLGLTANCASCHDHKFDPVSTKDFYSMAAYFRNTRQGGFDGNVRDSSPSILVPATEADRARWRAIPPEITAIQKRLENRRADARPDFGAWAAHAMAQPGGPSDSGLVAHVLLNDGSGDSVALARGGSASVPAPKSGSWKPDGKLGPAMVLKTGSTLDLGDLGDFERDQPFSYGAWVRVPGGGTYQSILARMDQADDFRGWDLFTHDRNYAVHVVHKWPDNALKVVTTENPMRPGEWHHVFVTYDGSSKATGIRIFVDGKPAKTRAEVDALTASIRTRTPLRVGQRSKDQVLENGMVQDARVYSRVLAPADILDLATANVARTLLALPEARRTDAHQNALFDHYLRRHDPGFFLASEQLARIEAEREAIRGRSPVTHVQAEKKDAMPMARVLFRGQYDKPRDTVVARPFGALHSLPEGAPTNRLGLAQWIVSPRNPLTARVTVNRFWQEVFGAGLVRTAEDFGVVGDHPSNQALLDWLAVEFIESGWDVQHLFRLMVTSSTYHQSAVVTPIKLEKDPQNRFLSRGPRFRMDAEMLRDHALAVSGLLQPKVGGPSVKPYQPDGVWEAVAMPESNTRRYQRDRGDALYRRSLYTFWKRAAPPAMMDTFNAPSREVCSVRRERTNTPLQALATLNDVTFVESARVLAQDLLRSGGGNQPQIIARLAQRALGRPFTPAEADVIRSTWNDMRSHYAGHPQEAAELLGHGESAPDPMLPPADFAALTLVVNQVFNLDEFLSK